MAAVAKTIYVTPQDYLKRERYAETKSEYHDGVVVAMAGASWEHNRIVFNGVQHIGNCLDDGPCQGVGSDLRVGIAECNRYYYPDLTVVCGEPRFEDAQFDTLTNPTLIVEVLSPSTESVDRGAKYACYTSLSSLAAYVLVAQEQPRVEVFARQEDGSWQRRMVEGLDASLSLPAIGCELHLAALYARVTFPPIEENGVKDTNDI